MNATNETLNKISDALTLVQEVDKVNAEFDGELMDTYGDIPHELRRFMEYNRVFAKFEELDAGVTPEKLESLIRKALAKPEVHFYEIYFGERKDYNEGEQPSICIRGVRKPSIEEANDWLKVECSFYGAPVTEIDEIGETFARRSYNMDSPAAAPVFGKDPPNPIHPARNCYLVCGLFRIWARNPEEAVSAFKETIEANRELLFKYNTFMAAVHGALEPFPLPRD